MSVVRKRVESADARSDAELLGLAHGGDRAALGALYDRHAQGVYGFARRFAAAAEAEDVVQATFLRIVDIAGSYDDRALSARAWIFGVAHRVHSERRRAGGRLARAVQAYGELRASSSDLGARHDAIDLERALARLAEAKRAVLVLTQVHGFSCEEVARMLELPVGTVWTRLHHARRELRAHLEGTS
jgi:RNA polymerase sigma-70 factor (ECF subfamily)